MSQVTVKQGTHYALMETGATAQWPDYTVSLPGIDIPGKLFIKESLALTGCEVSLNSMPSGGEIPFNHTHQQNEEVYVFIQGQGQMLLDGETINVKEGSIVRVDPQADRSWRNNSDAALVYLIIQVRQDSLNQYSLTDGVVSEAAPNWA